MDRKNFLAGIGALPLVVELAAAPNTEISGNWIGTLSYGDDSEPFALAFERGKDGKQIAYLWNPALGVYDLPASHVSSSTGSVRLIEAKLVLRYDGATLRGKLSPIGDTIRLTRASAPLPATPASPSPVLGTGPKARWTTTVGQIWNSLLASESIVYAGDTSGALHAIDGGSGAKKWTYEAGAPIFATAAVDRGALLLLDAEDTLHRIDVASGARVWAKSLGTGKSHDVPSPKSRQFDYRSATPLIVDGIVYIGTGSGIFYALDARTGDVRWRHHETSAIRSTAAFARGRVIFGTWKGAVVALDNRGRESWRLATGQPISMGVVCHERFAIAGSRDTLLYGIDVDSGKPVWKRYYFTSWVESAPVIVDGVAYIGSSDLHAVRAFDPATGKLRWNTTVYGWSWGTPLVRDGTVYIGTASMTPYLPGMLSGRSALRASDGTTLWRDAVPPDKGRVTGYTCGPVGLANGAIVYASVEGVLTCIS
jgi:outer membrane protein assembly factor BamB